MHRPNRWMPSSIWPGVSSARGGGGGGRRLAMRISWERSARCSKVGLASIISLQNLTDCITASEVFPSVRFCFKLLDSSTHVHQLSAPNRMKFATGRAVYSVAWVLNFIGHSLMPQFHWHLYNTNPYAMGTDGQRKGEGRWQATVQLSCFYHLAEPRC